MVIKMKADKLFVGGLIYNGALRKFCKWKLALKGSQIIYLGEDESDQIKAREIINVEDKYLVPGFIDIHMHIESSMTIPKVFAQEVITRGVTTVVSEPHEIANVLGLKGVEAMISASEDSLIDIFFAIPSSVPSTTKELETTGGEITPEDIVALSKLEKVLCLGEVMNNEAVIYNSNSRINKIIKAFKTSAPNKPIEGHIPNFRDLELCQLLFKGVDSDHTYHTIDQAKDHLKLGIHIQLQEKSLYKELIAYLKENASLEQISLVTDDVMADTLVDEGHLDKVIKKAIKLGFKAEEAIFMASESPARRMNLKDRGSLVPGKIADIVVLKDLDNLKIEDVYKNGEKVVSSKKLLMVPDKNVKQKQFPPFFYKTINLSPLKEEDFSLKTTFPENQKVKLRVIEVKNDSTYTEELHQELPVVGGEINWEGSDFSIVGVFSRYGNNSSSLGLVGGATIKSGAAATTFAHDHHNLLVVGQNKRDAVIAANWIINNQGGYCIVENGKIKASLKLPIAGILSEEPLEVIGLKLKEIREALHQLGYEHYNSIMSLSTYTLPVSPELKITDKGLVRVSSKEILPLVIK